MPDGEYSVLHRCKEKPALSRYREYSVLHRCKEYTVLSRHGEYNVLNRYKEKPALSRHEKGSVRRGEGNTVCRIGVRNIPC